MKCTYHARTDATYHCSECGKPLCEACALSIENRTFCCHCATETFPEIFQKRSPTDRSGRLKASRLLRMVGGALGLFGCVCVGLAVFVSLLALDVKARI